MIWYSSSSWGRGVADDDDLSGGVGIPPEFDAGLEAVEDGFGVVRAAGDADAVEEIADAIDIGGEGFTFPDGLVVVVAVDDAGESHLAGEVVEEDDQGIDAGAGFVDHGGHGECGVHDDGEIELSLLENVEVVDEAGEGVGIEVGDVGAGMEVGGADQVVSGGEGEVVLVEGKP